MKRKKTVPAEVVPKPVNDAAPVPEKDHPLYDRLFVVGFAVLLFFAMTVQTVPMSLILAAVALALSFGRGGYARFRGRLGIPVLGFLAFLILCGAASLYTSFGAYAYGEYAKLLASGALGLLLLARGREQNAGGLLFGFSAVCGVIGLLCIDAGCRGPLFRGFASFMEGLGDAAYQSLDQATYTGARFDGIYNDANLTGSLMALAVLVGLYLIRTGRKPWERFAACFLTGLSAVAFFTAMSRGAILCFGATLLAYLLIAGKEERLGLFFTMAAMGISMVVFGVVSDPPGRRLFLGNAGRSAERSAAVAAERVPRPEGGFRAGGAWKAPCRCAGRRDCRGNRGSCTGAHADGAVCIYREQLPLPGSRCRGRRDLYVFR